MDFCTLIVEFVNLTVKMSPIDKKYWVSQGLCCGHSARGMPKRCMPP